MPSPVSLIPDQEARELHARHLAGESLRQLARDRAACWGYRTAASAAEGLRLAWRRLGLPARPRLDVVRDVSTRHGDSTRAAALVGHPEHARFLTRRQLNRRRRREGVPLVDELAGTPRPLGDPRDACAWCGERPQLAHANVCRECDLIGWVELPDGSLIEECELRSLGLDHGTPRALTPGAGAWLDLAAADA